MRKQITIAIVVATLSVALVYASIAIGEPAKGQSNNTASGNATPVKNTDTTKGMTNATTSAAKNSSGPVVGSSGGSIGGAKAVSPSK